MSGLEGRKIAVAADRRAEEIRVMVQKHGGEAAVFSIQGKQQFNKEISHQNIRNFLEQDYDWALLTTGIGARTLEKAAVEIDRRDQFIEKLRRTKLAIRGSKTMSWMKEHGLQPDLLSEDGTMVNLLSQFTAESSNKSEQRIFLQAYDLDDAKIKYDLEKMGSFVYLSKPYSYETPDPHVITELKQAIYDQSFDAVIFTSKTQVKNLFADERDHPHLKKAFNDKVLGVAVGKVTASELKANGIQTVLEPDNPKMGAMVVEMARYYRQLVH